MDTGKSLPARTDFQLYKLICRRSPRIGGFTLLTSQAGRRRQRQRHAHQRFRSKDREESLLGFQRRRKVELKTGWEIVDRILTHGNDSCMMLKPQRERPIAASTRQFESRSDQASARQIAGLMSASHPTATKRRMRVEGRSVAPEATRFTGSVFHLHNPESTAKPPGQEPAAAERILPVQHYAAIENSRKPIGTTKQSSARRKCRDAT